MRFGYYLTCLTRLVSQCLAQTNPCSKTEAQNNVTASSTIENAAEAWVYGLPAYAIQQTRNYYLGLGVPLNSVLASPGLANAAQRSIVRPNADTIYSIAFFDLSQGPVVLHIPQVTDRYFVAAMYDAYTNNFANPGTLYNSSAGFYTMYGPQQAPCANVSSAFNIVSPTNDVWMIARFYVLNATSSSADLQKVRDLQTQLYVASTPSTIMSSMPSFGNTTAQSVQSFYGMHQAISDNPVQPAQYNQNFSTVGLISGRSFRPTLSPGNLTSAQALGNTSIANSVLRPGAIRVLNNGWVIPTTVGQYGDDYLARAYISNFGLGALNPDQAIYPTYVASMPNSTNAQAYAIYFPDGEPPTRGLGFWSLTLYDAQGFFVENSLERYSLGSRDALRKSVNGSFTIQASYRPPSGDTSNWLPAPDQQIWTPTLRIYGAAPEVMGGNWTYPMISKL